MEKFSYTVEENVAILTMSDGENRFNFEFFDAFHRVLDEIEQINSVTVLVVQSSHEKIWSNGVDVEWNIKNIEKVGVEFFEDFIKEMYRFLIRILTLPLITFAALTGHAFAGGAIMACAFDYRYMRDDKGWFCFTEVDLKAPFTPTLNAIILKAIPIGKANEMQLTAERMSAQDCLQYNIVKKVCPIDSMIKDIKQFALTLKKDRGTIKIMKERLFGDIVKIYEMEIKQDSDPTLPRSRLSER